jgi:hypothetical protein
MDGLTNIDPPGNLADQDLADDGVRLKPSSCRCQKTRLNMIQCRRRNCHPLSECVVQFNHDGDWNDTPKCQPPGGGPTFPTEWAVTNSMLGLGNGYYPGLYNLSLSLTAAQLCPRYQEPLDAHHGKRPACQPPEMGAARQAAISMVKQKITC